MTLFTIHISSGFPICFCNRLNVFNQLYSILRKLLDSIVFQIWCTTLICETFCTIWYHLYNFKNVKNTHGSVLPLVKLEASACNFAISNTPPWVFSRSFNCSNGIKLRKASHIFIKSTTFISCCFNQFYISDGFNINAICSKLVLATRSFLLKTATRNLAAITIILFCLNQLETDSDSCCIVFKRSDKFLRVAVIVF